MGTSTIPDDLSREVDRIKNHVIPTHVRPGENESFPLVMMRRTLDAASRAMAAGDIAAMALAYQSLRAYTAKPGT